MASSARIDELKKKFDENPRRYFAPLANEYRKVGDLDQAMFICEAHLPQQPGHMSGHIVYAQTLFEMGRYDESKAAFGTALALDPENMIALRHLGDIARQAGDLNTAREWYERVLEADPRNDEIVQVMALLREEYARSVTGSAPSGGTSSPPAADPAAASVSSPATSPIAAPVSYPPPPAPSAPVVSAHEMPPADDDFGVDDELLDLDSMMIGETPLSTPAVPAAATGGETSEVSESDTDAQTDQGAFESDPLAIAADLPPLELATDLHLGLVDDGTQSDVAPSEASPLEGLRSYEPGVIAERDQIVDSSLEMEPFYDVLHGDSTPSPSQPAEREAESPAGSENSVELPSMEAAAPASESGEFPIGPSDQTATPVDTAPATRIPTPSVASEIFVTETMAELYLQQGHADSALDIYRKLVEQRPNDASLLERMRHLEDQLFGSPSAAAEPQGDLATAAAASPDDGLAEKCPTIREFLLGLIGRGWDGSSETNGAASASRTPENTMSRHTLPGSIDALFLQGDASTNDSNAATALGEAFGMSDIDADLTGELTHPGLSDAPSDRISSGGTPSASQAAEGFSFDQFFAGETNVVPPKPSSEMGGPPVESPEDIAQFNAWLNGLKKT